MPELVNKVVRKLRLPLPALLGYLMAAVSSKIWSLYLLQVGKRFHIGLGARIQGARFVQIGSGFHAGRFLWIEAVGRYIDFEYSPSVRIGNDVVFSEFVHVAATTEVTIGDGVLLGSRVHITDHSHGVYGGNEQSVPTTPPSRRQLSSGRPVRVERNVWLGDGVTVLPGVTIGAGTIVGANSVVSKDLPPEVMAVGSPARAIKRFDAASSTWVSIS